MATTYTYVGKNEERIPMDVEILTIDASVQELPSACCKKRIKLQQVIFSESFGDASNGLKVIGRNAFRSCPALETIQIPSTVQLIEGYAFGFCSALKEVEFPEGLKEIARRSFFTCSALERIKIPSTLGVIESYTFHSCSALREVDLSDAMLTRIGSYAFHSCTSLESIKAPKTVEAVDEYAFLRCRSLAEVDLPEGLVAIGPGAFSGCRSLAAIKIPSTVKVIRVHTFFECKSLKVIEIQEGTIELGEHAFEKCTSLKAMALTKSIQTIGFCAFNRCESLISMEVPRQLDAWFQEGAFHECHSLANICLPPQQTLEGQEEAGTKIHYTCFDECTLLQDQYGFENTVEGLSTRFDNFPVHLLCYHASTTTCEELRQEVRNTKWTEKKRLVEQQAYQDHWTDPFGMTPFHILCSAAKCRPDLLEVLLEEYPSNMLDWKDGSGNLAIDNLGYIWTDPWKAMMQTVLQKWMLESISSWGLESWKIDMQARVNGVLVLDDRDEREDSTHNTRAVLQGYIDMESTSLLELALWKMEMISMASQKVLAKDDFEADREVARTRCGASFVLPNVVAFWN